MFKNLKKNTVKRFSIGLEDLLLPYWNILKEWHGDNLLLSLDFSSIDIAFDNERKAIKLVNDVDKKENMFRIAFSLFCEQLNRMILDNDNLNKSLLKSTLLLVKRNFKSQFIIIQDTTTKRSNSLDELKNLYFKKKILNILIDTVIKEDGLFDCLKALDQHDFYNNIFGDYDDINELEILSSCYHISLLDSAQYQTKDYDIDSIWLNTTLLKSNYNINLPISPNTVCKLLVHNIKDDIDEAWGIIIEDYVFVLRQDIDNIINHQKSVDYYWLLFENNIFRDANKTKKTLITDLRKKFLDSSKNVSFTNLLSNIKDNLYIADVPVDYAEYFDQLIKLHTIEGLETYNLFVHDTDKLETVIGAYNKQRLSDDKSFNLKHLIEHSNSKLNCWKPDAKESKPKQIVNVLKPELAYFFLEKYFEDFLDLALLDIKVQFPDIMYLTNYHVASLPNIEHEIDMIVKVHDNLYFIEAKTKLSTLHINKYIEKCAQWTTDFSDIREKLHFVIIGCHSNEELNVFKYSITQDEKRENYNPKREGLNTIPYYFKVPIKDTQKDLICCTEPSFTILKETMKGILGL